MVGVGLGPLAHRCHRNDERRAMLPEEVLQLFRLQRGLAARHQILDAVTDPRDRRRIYRHPELTDASSRVLRHLAVPWSIEQELMLGVLDAGRGARLWSKSAASHWGFTRFRRLPAHVATVRRSSRGTEVAQLHQVRSLDCRDVVFHDDIPLARPEVVILWLCGMWTHRLGHDLALERAEVAVDQAWRQRLIDGEFIHELADRSGGRGRSGIVVLRELLEKRPPDYQPAGSRLEERFEEVVPWTVRRELRRQVTVDVEQAIRTVDFRLDAWPLIAEINGEAFHTSLTDRAADDRRYDRLLELGFSVVVWWEYDVWHDPAIIATVMLDLLRNPDQQPTLHRPTRAPWET